MEVGIMSIFDSEEDLKEFNKFCIANSRELIKHLEEVVKVDPTSEAVRGMLENQKNHFSQMQEDYNRQYGKTDIKKLTAKEKTNIAFNKEFTVVRGGLYKLQNENI
jgi:D-serine dehydratase